MSNINDYDIKEVMPIAIRLYGKDAAMESCQTMAQLAEWIGEEQVQACIAEL